jgi:hypothetical protein
LLKFHCFGHWNISVLVIVSDFEFFTEKPGFSFSHELLDFRRVNGRLKTRECRDLLERLEAMGLLRLPAKKATGGVGPRKRAAALP